MIHSDAQVSSKSIGDNTNIWQYVVILENAKIGRNCNICSHCFIENDVVIGDNVTIKSGVQLWDGIKVEDDVFIGPNVTFTNDKYPKSKKYPEEFEKTTIKNGASIGAGAVILPSIKIGKNSMIGAGSVVTRDVPDNSIVVGNPAKIVGYSSTKTKASKSLLQEVDDDKIIVAGVSFHKFPIINDIRGDLTVGEFSKDIPFTPKRFFSVFNVPNKEVRGEHAHIKCHQFLICIHGSCNVLVDDGKNRQEILLDQPNKGLYLKPLTWGVQYKYSNDAVLLVFASHYYDSSDYIRDYDEFLNFLKK